MSADKFHEHVGEDTGGEVTPVGVQNIHHRPTRRRARRVLGALLSVAAIVAAFIFATRDERSIKLAREHAAASITRGDIDERSLREEMLRLKPEDWYALQMTAWSHQQLGHPDKKAAMYERALALAEAAKDEPWIAVSASNLGLIYATRGELDRAEEMHKKALAMDVRLVNRAGMAADYANFGIINYIRGDLGEAERMCLKSLELNEKLRRHDEIPALYAYLGLIRQKQGRIAGAREHWERARDLYRKIGMPHEVKRMETWLAGLPD